jgi:hypothetical protein
VPLAAGVLFPAFGLLLNSDDCGGCDEFQFRFCDRQCAETADDETMNRWWQMTFLP